MNQEHHELESLLRSLQPKAIPSDIAARMEHPPAPLPNRKRTVIRFFLAAAAAVALWIATTANNTPIRKSPETITIRKQQSTLVESRPIALVEHEGQIWELHEEEWRDEDAAICSATPISVHLARTRHELAYHPVKFY